MKTTDPSPDIDPAVAAHIATDIDPALRGLSLAQVCELAGRLQAELRLKTMLVDKLTHEMAVLKRLKFAARSEGFNLEQRSLLDEAIDADIAALALELEGAQKPAPQAPTPRVPKRRTLPANLPRRDVHHEPERTTCSCGCALARIGEDVAEKLDYTPGTFTVERHVRGKWACARCQTLVQAPVPAHVIDKGLATAGLLAHVAVAKYVDHQPLYRQESVFERAGFPIPRSTQAEWIGAIGVQLAPLVEAMRADLLQRAVLHADETPVAMLKPANDRDGKTHRAYLWSYCTTAFDDIAAVVFDFAESRAGRHARHFLGVSEGVGHWRGTLVCDDYSGYKQLMATGVTEAGCMAHARRKFHELWVNHSSTLAEDALELMAQLYEIEREVKELPDIDKQRIRQLNSRPVAELLHSWLMAHRPRVPDGSATARAMDYTLKRWTALTRFIDDGAVPINNNRVENLIRPIALGRKNWLFAGSLRAGERAASIMSLLQTAKLNGHCPYVYLKDVLERLPTQPASRIAELLPYHWRATPSDA